MSRSVQVRTTAAPARADSCVASHVRRRATTTSSTPRIAQKSGSDQASGSSRRVAYEAATAIAEMRHASRDSPAARAKGCGQDEDGVARAFTAPASVASKPRATSGAIAAEYPGAKSTMGPAQSANVPSCASLSAPVR